MKPLLKTKVTRERQSVGDWIPAESQATLEGTADFWKRQQERMKAAQEIAEERRAKVSTIKRREKA